MKNGFYVYRFKNEDNVIIYVGRTTDLDNRFKQHEHLTNDVKTIEYIECQSEADMIWKEIYYINLYKNDKTTNTASVGKGEVTRLNMNDIWKIYINVTEKKTDEIVLNNYKEYVINPPKYNYKVLINILDHEKMNFIGEEQYALTKRWFDEYKNDEILKKLKNNIINFFNNIIKSKSNKNMWTTYDQYKDTLKAKGYSKGYISNVSDKSDINYSERNTLAYLKNDFYSPNILFSIDQDTYALLEILEFIFQSALINEQPINIYIPSKRMRELLIKWINEQKYED